jgi:hypothetical protein
MRQFLFAKTKKYDILRLSNSFKNKINKNKPQKKTQFMIKRSTEKTKLAVQKIAKVWLDTTPSGKFEIATAFVAVISLIIYVGVQLANQHH